MGLLGKIFGRTLQDYEARGDEKSECKLWGEAKVAYETALEKLDKEKTPALGFRERIEGKLALAKESLAAQHVENAGVLIESGCHDDARELLGIVLTLTQSPQVVQGVEKQLREIEIIDQQAMADVDVPDELYGLGEDAEEESMLEEESDDESYFLTLCGTLPDTVQAAYLSYGDTFREGYLALNRGDFETAVKALSEAMAENASPGSYIPYELAGAQLNLGQNHEAKLLLEKFIPEHPDMLPAYRLLCEVYWDEEDFESAKKLLDGLPEEKTETVAAFLLRGENMCRSGRYEEAKNFYKAVMDKYGWNSIIARELAHTFEVMGKTSQALNLYSELINECTGCGKRIDPYIKRKFADLRFASGDNSTRLLELYLDLAQEDTGNAADYYRKVSRIYGLQGNSKEQKRFSAISEKYAAENHTEATDR